MLIRKFIVRSGPTPIGYDGAKVNFAPARLAGWAQKANAMIRGSDGVALGIPAPPKHDENAIPHIVGALQAGEEYSADNMGYWKKFETQEEWDAEDGGRYTALYGIIDAPDGGLAPKPGEDFAEVAKTDPNRISAFLNTPAGKLYGTNGEDATVKTVSIRTYDQFIDPKGRKWDDVIVHVSPCLHPALTQQKPFERVQGDHAGLALSVSLAASAVSESVGSEVLEKPDNEPEKNPSKATGEMGDDELIASIAPKLKAVGVFLKPVESLRDFLEALDIALTQVVGDDTNDLDPTQDGANKNDPDKNLIRKGTVMSTAGTPTPDNPTPAGTPAPAATPPVAQNPPEPAKFDPKEFESGVLLSVARQNLAPQVRQNCETRLAALKDVGLDDATVGKVQNLIGGINGVSLSVARDDKGEVTHTPTEAEKALDWLETAMSGVVLSSSRTRASGVDSVPNPHKGQRLLSEQELNKELDDAFGGTIGTE